MVERLPHLGKALGLRKLSLMRAHHAWSPSPWEIEVGEPKVQGHPQKYSEFQTSLGYMHMRSWVDRRMDGWIYR